MLGAATASGYLKISVTAARVELTGQHAHQSQPGPLPPSKRTQQLLLRMLQRGPDGIDGRCRQANSPDRSKVLRREGTVKD